MKKSRICFLFSLLWGILNLSPASAEEVRLSGEQHTRGDQPIWAWATMKQNTMTSIGITIKAEALNDLPSEYTVYVLSLPKGVNTRPFRHVMVDWAPQGHEPDPIYGVPHFDFHFYMISSEKRESITCSGADQSICKRQPSPQAIPPDYVPTPEGVPAMGWHWVDSKSGEFQGQPFTATLIEGYYDGKWIFIEPMATLAFLQSKPNFVAPIKQPQIYPQKGSYPKEYAVIYRSVQDEYDIVLRKMVYRK